MGVAISNREKTLIGGMLIVAGVVVVGLLMVQPLWEQVSKNWSKMTQLEQENKSLAASVALLQQEATRLKNQSALPPGVVIREYDLDTLEENTRSMLNEVVSLAKTHGNELIGLEPKEGDALVIAPEPPPTDASGQPANTPTTPATTPPSSTGATPSSSSNATPNPSTSSPATAPAGTAPTIPVENPLKALDYELSIRGGYESILSFLKSLNTHQELIEISSIQVKNESGDTSGGAQPAVANPAKPIRLTARLRLFLRQEN